MPDLAWFVIIGFATFRLWRLLAVDNIFQTPRAALPSRAQSFISCAWCAGFWLSVITYFVWRWWGDIEWVGIVIIIFAVSGLVGLLAHATGSGSE